MIRHSEKGDHMGLRHKSYRFVPGLAFGALFLLSVGLAPDDPGHAHSWPTWRGPNVDNKATQKGIFFDQGSKLTISWKKNLGSGYSAVSIAHGHAITMFSDHTFDYLVALDAETGVEQWRVRIDSTYQGVEGAADGPLSTPAIDGDRVYGLGPRGHLLAVDLETGRILWTTHLVDDHNALLPHWGFTTSPLISGDLLIVETGGTKENAISCFNKNNGELRWATGNDEINYQSPTLTKINGRTHLICAGNNYLFGLNPESGEELWKYRHDGNGFYKQVLNPVAVDHDKLFLTYRSSESKLVQIRQDNDKFIIDDLWTSRHLGRNYNVPIYHEGYIYGYNGNFLSCIDAKSGKLAWKSRPPGTGFLILVDQHLVIITKKGSLHVTKASPEGYSEIAGLKLFDKMTWTPASFADGRIYARSFLDERIASVEIVPTDEITSISPGGQEQITLPNSDFGRFVERVKSSPDKKTLIDEFMRRQKQFPILEGDSLVHIIYRGEVEDIALRGDMFEATRETPMSHIDGTNFYFASFKFEPDARLNYQFVTDLDRPISDPLNPRKAESGLAAGEVSEIFMPRSVLPYHIDEPETSMRGRLDSLTFTTEERIVGRKTWGGSRKIQIYLPYGYHGGTRRYPVVYVNYGQQAVQHLKMPNSLDNLIGRTIKPIIAVFVHSTSGYEYARSQREHYARMMAEEIVPYIDERYRTIANPGARAMIGGDEGGYAAYYVAFKHPATFGMVAGQSIMHVTQGGDELVALVQDSQKLSLQLYLDWGKYDYRAVAEDTPHDVAQFGRKFKKVLEAKGYTVTGGQVNDGSGFTSWRVRTDRILETFFSIRKTGK